MKDTERKNKNSKGITKQSENNKIASVSPHQLISTLNMNGLNLPIKSHKESG